MYFISRTLRVERRKKIEPPSLQQTRQKALYNYIKYLLTWINFHVSFFFFNHNMRRLANVDSKVVEIDRVDNKFLPNPADPAVVSVSYTEHS